MASVFNVDETKLYRKVTKRLRLEKGTYSWAKDCLAVWHRSKAEMLSDAIESYADGVPRIVFNKHLQDDKQLISKFTTMKELLLYVMDVAQKEGF